VAEIAAGGCPPSARIAHYHLFGVSTVRRMADKASKLSNTCAAQKLRLRIGEIPG